MPFVSLYKDYYQPETLLSRVINDAWGYTPNIQMVVLSVAPSERKYSSESLDEEEDCRSSGANVVLF